MKKLVRKEKKQGKEKANLKKQSKTAQQQVSHLPQAATTRDQQEAELSQLRHFILHLGRGRSQGRSFARLPGLCSQHLTVVHYTCFLQGFCFDQSSDVINIGSDFLTLFNLKKQLKHHFSSLFNDQLQK